MFMRVSTDLLVGVRLALRARFVLISFCGLLLLLVAATLGAQFSGRQPATVALDVGVSVIRFVLPVVAVLLLQELLSREFDRRLHLSSLTYPRPRCVFLLGRFAAIALLSLILLIVLAAALAALVGWVGRAYEQATPPSLGLPYVLTLALVALDLSVVLAIGTLLGVFASTSGFVLLGSLGFMLVARSYGNVVALLQLDTTLVVHAGTYQSSLSLLGYLLPDLGALDVRMITLYDSFEFLPADLGWRVVAALAYSLALFALAVWTLDRRNFS